VYWKWHLENSILRPHISKSTDVLQ
jgi:hypothetical protein